MMHQAFLFVYTDAIIRWRIASIIRLYRNSFPILIRRKSISLRYTVDKSLSNV